ncbi:MAG TPA: DUF4157 domain-containing protein, partial [Terriglobales bacterium]|nr:DUF4157 domain-containing protein [Terriglobales bacterium]
MIRSPGQPLDPATRAYMESRFGHNFGNVRVHKDTKSADSARAVNAQAYTVGQQIVFGANQFSPTSPHGRELLAHELAHTIQQRNAASGPPAPDPNGVFESTADAAGRAVALGQSAFADFPVCGIGLLRQPVDPKAFNDDELAEELKRLSANLKPGDEPSWRLRALQKEAGQRGWARAEAETEARQRAE